MSPVPRFDANGGAHLKRMYWNASLMLATFEPVDLDQFAILLDVDGTILDIAPTPRGVHVPDGLRESLALLLERTCGAIALVSGRPVGELDVLFAPLRLPVIGGHGAEMRRSADPNDYEQHASALDPKLKRELLAIVACHPGVAYEDKGYSLALHYRAVPEHELEVVEQVFQVCKPHPPKDFEILTGKAVIEVKARGFDKGTAVRRLMMHRPFAGRTPIFIGDDTTDEAAFAVMPDFNGIPISVGRKVPGIAGRFQSPADVRHWLQHLVTEAVPVS